MNRRTFLSVPLLAVVPSISALPLVVCVEPPRSDVYFGVTWVDEEYVACNYMTALYDALEGIGFSPKWGSGFPEVISNA